MRRHSRNQTWKRAARAVAAVAPCVVLVSALGACASRVVPVAVDLAPRYPEFVQPLAPQGLGDAETVSRHERAWQLLQSGDLRNAERAFTQALRRTPSFYPAVVGLGYVRLAERAFAPALAEFSRALEQEQGYVPALVGRGEALLGAARPLEALDSFHVALARDPSLVDLRRRVEVVALRVQQDLLDGARRASEAGRLDEARQAYEQAIAASPDSGFLYRELAALARRQGDADAALAQLRRAVDLDASDAASWTAIGEILEVREDYDGAVAAYARAVESEPGAAAGERLARARRLAMLAALPGEFRAIEDAPRITRGELAALVGVRLESLLRDAPPKPAAVITDSRDHWAAAWILAVTRAGVMEVFPNHTFQPTEPLRRADLAIVAGRLLQLLSLSHPGRLREWQAGRPAIADLPPAHLSYAAAALVVTAGVMPLIDGGRFEPARPVSGAEAAGVVARVEVLSR